MKLVGRKTRKIIRKSVKKIVKKHGSNIVAALAGGIASSLATLAKTEAADGRGKSNLAKAAESVSETLVGDKGKTSRKRGRVGKKFGKKGTGSRPVTARAQGAEGAM